MQFHRNTCGSHRLNRIREYQFFLVQLHVQLLFRRLRNLFALPQQITRKAHIEKLRIYVSGENLFFWSPLKKYAKNYDPEMITAGDADFASKTGTDGQGYGYPMTRSVTIGLNINF